MFYQGMRPFIAVGFVYLASLSSAWADFPGMDCLNEKLNEIRRDYPDVPIQENFLQDIVSAAEKGDPESQSTIAMIQNQDVFTSRFGMYRLGTDGQKYFGLPFDPYTKGEKENTYRPYRMDSKVLSAGPEDGDLYQFRQETIQGMCSSYFGELGPYCTRAFFKKEENLNGFIKDNWDLISETAEDIGEHPDRAYDYYARFTETNALKFESADKNVTLTNLEWAHKLYIDPSDLGGSVETSLMQWMNGGFNLPIKIGEETQGFFAPSVPGKPGVFYNPVYFTFGGPEADEWNALVRR